MLQTVSGRTRTDDATCSDRIPEQVTPTQNPAERRRLPDHRRNRRPAGIHRRPASQCISGDQPEVHAHGGVDRPRPERALHQHGVEPAAELEADVLDRADEAEAGGAVQFDRWRLRRVADDCDHLAKPALLRLGDEPVEQRPADAAAMQRRRHVDRILDAEAIGRTRPVGARIGIAGERAVGLGHQIGEACVDQRLLPPRHLGRVGRLELERGGAVAHRVIVDRRDGGNVGRGRGADQEAHGTFSAQSFSANRHPRSGRASFADMLTR